MKDVWIQPTATHRSVCELSREELAAANAGPYNPRMRFRLLLVLLGTLAGGTAAAAPEGPAAAPGVTFSQEMARVLQQPGNVRESHGNADVR